MNAKKVTITSKNQITLPIEYVRKIRLTRNRVLNAELRGSALVLTPQPTFGTTMQKFWTKHNAVRPLTDAEMKQAIRSSSTSRLVRKRSDPQ